MISLDTETTGLDLYHGAKAYFVTTCSEDGEEQLFWEWDVDPLTREPSIPPEDRKAIAYLIENADGLVLHNAKFDATALSSLLQEFGLQWPWEKTYCTLRAAHLLASNQPHDLTSLAIHYLGIDIQPYEKALEDAVKDCRRKVQQARLRIKRRRKKDVDPEDEPLAEWRIAEEGLEEMPSAGKEFWRADGWLPRAYAKYENLPPDHLYWTVLRDYANADSAATILLWKGRGNRWIGMESEIIRRGHWALYTTCLKTLPIANSMEERGVTVHRPSLCSLREQYGQESLHAEKVCSTIAADYGHELEMPKGGARNASLVSFIFDVLKMPVVKKANKGKGGPSIDKYVLEEYEARLPPNSKPLAFFRSLRNKRARDTAVTYLNAYERFWLPWFDTLDKKVAACFRSRDEDRFDEWYVLHPNLNPTGTDTLRWSCSCPNEQNISKQERLGMVSLRSCFGPAPGREFWSLDAQNIELRIPGYEAGEDDMVALFENPDEPPYYGSNHLLNFHTVYPDLWNEQLKVYGIEKVGPVCKKKYASTWYQWCKNGGFGVQYGAIDRDGGGGTADIAFHKVGAHALLKRRFRKIHGPGGLNERCIRFAEEHGYVETIPDRSVDPKHGYPLLCTRTEWGRVLPTVPLNYRVQGTACWWMMRAMIRCQEQLDKWRAEDGFDGHITMQIHDELVFDFPKSREHPSKDAEREKARSSVHGRPTKQLRTSNLWRIRIIQKLMAQGGEDIGVPTPVGCEYHEKNWAEGITM
jgi:DNA polymerase I-like protein with 3'-5' exonuclease and polymerase domains